MNSAPIPAPGLTEHDFMRGNPESIITAIDPSVFVLWAHGDETLGARVGHHMYSQRPELLMESVDYACLNPIAAAQEPPVRDTSNFPQPVEGYSVPGTDANRSYSPSDGPQSYEEHRDAWVLSLIAERGYDSSLDVHTTKSDLSSCLIVSEEFFETPDTRRIIAASRLSRIIVLPLFVPSTEDPSITKPLVTLGLIGKNNKTVSIEYSRDVADAVGVPETMMMIDNLLTGNQQFADTPRDVFYVTHSLPKNLDFSTIRNCQQHPDGYWPVLCSADNEYGKDPSKDYSGFAATRREIVRI
jgi:hypothetical protein